MNNCAMHGAVAPEWVDSQMAENAANGDIALVYIISDISVTSNKAKQSKDVILHDYTAIVEYYTQTSNDTAIETSKSKKLQQLLYLKYLGNGTFKIIEQDIKEK